VANEVSQLTRQPPVAGATVGTLPPADGTVVELPFWPAAAIVQPIWSPSASTAPTKSEAVEFLGSCTSPGIELEGPAVLPPPKPTVAVTLQEPEAFTRPDT
jgi:hypothetical protein